MLRVGVMGRIVLIKHIKNSDSFVVIREHGFF